MSEFDKVMHEIDKAEAYSVEEIVEFTMRAMGWTRKRALREVTEAIESGELPAFTVPLQ